MTIVWVVYGWWPYEGGRVVSVFDSEDGAQRFIEREQAMHGQPDQEDPDGGIHISYPEYEAHPWKVRR